MHHCGRSLGLLTFCCRTGAVIEPKHYQVRLKGFFFFWRDWHRVGTGMGVEPGVCIRGMALGLGSENIKQPESGNKVLAEASRLVAVCSGAAVAC